MIIRDRPVHRQVIGNFADDHLRQQRRTCRTLPDGLRRFACCLHRACARVLFANFLDHQQLRGNVFVTFARFFPDVAQVFAAGGAVFFFFGQIVFDPFALQMRRAFLTMPPHIRERWPTMFPSNL
jgi:hypothetical protein